MGYYFPKAKTTADLNPEQIERYKMLRSKGMESPPQLKEHFEAVKERIGPLTSGEIMSAFEELWQDAVVNWILFGENPDIEWVYPEAWKDERTPEELQRDREAWKNTLREWKERDVREKREFEEWERKTYPIRTFFRDLFARFRKGA